MKYINDLVSIMIPCFNGEKYLEKCLKSLLNQSYDKLEVIIVNDGSTDGSEKIIDNFIPKFKKKGMELIKINQSNQGQASAINNALQYVKGEYFMWQDADDWYELDAVESLVKCIKEKKMNFVRGEVANHEENNIDKILYYSRSKDCLDKNIFNDYVFEHDSYSFPGIWIVNTKYFDSCVKDRKIYLSRAGQNWQLILPIAYSSKCGYLNKVVYNYRIVDNSHSHSVKKLNDLLRRCDEHEDILIHVINKINNISHFKLINYRIGIWIKYRIKKIYLVLWYLKRKVIKHD